MRALRDGACGDGWPRDETLSANAPELCAYCGFTIYMRRYENRSPVLVGTGTSARTATRGYCTAATSHGVQDGVLPRRTAAARVATHQLTRSPRRVTRIAGRTVDSTAGSSPTKRRSNKLIWCSSLLPAAALLIVDRIARGRHRWASAMAQLAPCDCILMRTPAE